jgi:hypothetical protein
MRNNPETGEPVTVNRRNLLIVLGAIGGIWLLSNIDGLDIDFDLDDESPSVVLVGGSDEEADAAIAKAEARIETAAKRIEARVKERVRERSAERGEAFDQDKMDAAVEELKQGKPERFLELMERN